ncbi:unnamed protein product [Tuber aestivum]|uniref:Uncharacterized protein n=1 Tax=Tuber aestivum TaxID=59557 RepID=A0A292PLR2_9PEZI|nr:unnamed protein product [Tuber aestivum]
MNDGGDGITIADSKPDGVSIEEYIQQGGLVMRVTNELALNNRSNASTGSLALPPPIMDPNNRYSSPTRLSPERTMDDRLSPERDLGLTLPRLPSSRHVSPARETSPQLPSPDPSEPSYTPAPTVPSVTPPSTIPPSSFGSTNRAPSTAGTENSFEVLSGYDPVPPSERHKQWHRDQRREMFHPTPTSAFRPNADLPYPITPQLLRYYPFGNQNSPAQAPPQQPQVQRGEEFMMARRYEQELPPPGPSPSPYRGQGGVYESRFSARGQMVGASSGGHYRSSSSDVSVGGSSCSGIPSFAREFEPRGWRIDPILTESSHHSSQPGSVQRKPDSIVSVYANEFASQLDLILRSFKRPLVTLIFLGFFGVIVSILMQNLNAASQFPGPFSPTNPNSSFRHASYADFPTLMNIESSFEKIVDSAAGGSALARVMKQSEMAVSDLSTVVRYSELKCKETLAERLDVFAKDAKGNVRALQGFGSKVGGVLDQLLSINQYALRELTTIQHQSHHRSFLTKLLNPITSLLTSTPTPDPTDPQTHARISETFNKAAEVLESNLRLLVSDGETIFTSLTALTEQHKPIYDEIVREVVDIKKEEALVLSSLWTRFGGNAAQRKNFRENAQLLAVIGSYEEQARGYVESTVLELDRMTADLELLRRRVAEPLLVDGGSAGVGGARGKARGAQIPLSVHIEAIEGAVARLVRKRAQRREREGNWIEKMEGARKEEILVES